MDVLFIIWYILMAFGTYMCLYSLMGNNIKEYVFIIASLIWLIFIPICSICFIFIELYYKFKGNK